MNREVNYSKYRPKLYRIRTPIFWWLRKWSSIKFITRELTSLFVAMYAVVLILQLRALAHGPDSYAAFVSWLKTPGSIVLHGVAFVFVIFHSITWFNLAPKAIVIRIGKKRLPGGLIAASNYIAWAFFSVLIAWLELGS